MAFSRVQGNNNYASGNATTIATTISAVGSGNVVCGIVSWENFNGVTLSSVTDNQGNTYNVETTITDTTNNQKGAAFSLTNITNAPTTITANFSGTIGFRGIVVDEFSGGSTASTDERDGAAHGGQLQSSPGTATDGITSGTFTTSTNGDLLYGATINTASPTNASNGTSFSTGGSIALTDYSMQTEYREQTTAGSGTAATFTQATNHAHITFMVAIKPPAGAGDTLFVGGGVHFI